VSRKRRASQAERDLAQRCRELAAEYRADPELDSIVDGVGQLYGPHAWFLHVVAWAGRSAALHAIADVIDAGGPSAMGAKPITAVTNAVARAVRREMVLRQLGMMGWNLARAAVATGVGTTSGEMIREIRKLGLVGEWNAARDRGAVKPGRPAPRKQRRNP
jgi:hypothetical protein